MSTRRMADAIVLGALLAALMTLVHGCAWSRFGRKVNHRSATVKVPTSLSPCALGRPPADTRFATTRQGCPLGLVCYAPADLTALLDELEARREYDARVAACLAESPPNRTRVTPAP